jgi:hypothetical protein
MINLIFCSRKDMQLNPNFKISFYDLCKFTHNINKFAQTAGCYLQKWHMTASQNV